MTHPRRLYLLPTFLPLLPLAIGQLLLLLLELLQSSGQRGQLLLGLLWQRKGTKSEVLLQGWRPPPPTPPPTLMSLVRVCSSAVNSTLWSSSCCRFCTSLLSRSFSSLVSLTRLFSIWIWSCWSWISLRLSSILLEAACQAWDEQTWNVFVLYSIYSMFPTCAPTDHCSTLEQHLLHLKSSTQP